MTNNGDAKTPVQVPTARVLGREERVLPKRFYKDVGLGAVMSGFAILLDGHPVKTPTKNELVLPKERLATAVAEEWAAQATHIDPGTMPLTKLANTALDRVRGREDEIVAEIAAFSGSDLVCYRADRPEPLVRAQADAWDPVLEWAEEKLRARFVVVDGVMHKPQPAGSVARVRDALADYDPFALTALHNMTTLTGSVLLALAHAAGHLDLEAAWEAAHVDEDHQIAEWGEDAEATARRAFRWREMQAAGRLLELSR